MKTSLQTDYDTYREIMNELLHPIPAGELDHDTLKRLYESKAVYLENLRTKCFRELNGLTQTHFTKDDYALVLRALEETRSHLRHLILGSVSEKLSKRRVS